MLSGINSKIVHWPNSTRIHEQDKSDPQCMNWISDPPAHTTVIFKYENL